MCNKQFENQKSLKIVKSACFSLKIQAFSPPKKVHLKLKLACFECRKTQFFISSQSVYFTSYQTSKKKTLQYQYNILTHVTGPRFQKRHPFHMKGIQYNIIPRGSPKNKKMAVIPFN